VLAVRCGRFAPGGASRRGAAPLVVVSSSSRGRCGFRAATIAPTARGSRNATTPPTSRGPLRNLSPALRRLADCMPVLVTSSLRPLGAARSADRADSPSARPPVLATLCVASYRCGVPGSHIPTSPYLGPLVARRFQGHGFAARASLQVEVQRLVLSARVVDRRPLPGVRSVLVSCTVRGSFRCGPRGFARRCAAWALRACGFAVGAVRVAADRSRAAWARRLRSGYGPRSGPCTGEARREGSA